MPYRQEKQNTLSSCPPPSLCTPLPHSSEAPLVLSVLGGKCQSSCSSVHVPVPRPVLVFLLHRLHPCPAGAATGGAQGHQQTRSGGERLGCGLAHVTPLGGGFSLVQRPPHPHPTPQLSPGPGHPLPTLPAHPAAPSRYPWRAWTLGRNRRTGPGLFHPLWWKVQTILVHALPPPALWLGGGQ